MVRHKVIYDAPPIITSGDNRQIIYSKWLDSEFLPNLLRDENYKNRDSGEYYLEVIKILLKTGRFEKTHTHEYNKVFNYCLAKVVSSGYLTILLSVNSSRQKSPQYCLDLKNYPTEENDQVVEALFDYWSHMNKGLVMNYYNPVFLSLCSNFLNRYNKLDLLQEEHVERHMLNILYYNHNSNSMFDWFYFSHANYSTFDKFIIDQIFSSGRFEEFMYCKNFVGRHPNYQFVHDVLGHKFDPGERIDAAIPSSYRMNVFL